MASTVTKLYESQFGGKVFQLYDVAAGAADTDITISTGLSNVLVAIYQQSLADAAALVYKNSDSASATQDDFGDVFISPVANSDTGMVLVIGN